VIQFGVFNTSLIDLTFDVDYESTNQFIHCLELYLLVKGVTGLNVEQYRENKCVQGAVAIGNV